MGERRGAADRVSDVREAPMSCPIADRPECRIEDAQHEALVEMYEEAKVTDLERAAERLRLAFRASIEAQRRVNALQDELRQAHQAWRDAEEVERKAQSDLLCIANGEAPDA